MTKHQNNNSLILGIDIGGTFTRYVLMDQDGQRIHERKDESLHYRKVGFAGITDGLYRYTNEMISSGYNPSTFKVAIGIAGYGDDKESKKEIENAIHKVFPNALVYNDTHFAYISQFGQDEGVFVISGTGSIAFKKEHDTFYRSGGFGYLIDDAGSGFWIGKKILERFVAEVDGREKRSNIYHTLLEKLKLNNPYEIVDLVFKQKEDYRNFVANISLITDDLDNDYVRQVHLDAGKHLAKLANAFKLKEKTPITVGGGVILNNRLVLDSFVEHLDNNYEYFYPKNRVEYAAYILYQNQSN